MAAFLNTLANNVRNATFTPEERINRENGKRALEMIKLASLVSAIAAVFFVVIIPKVIVFCLALLVALGAHEVHKMADNVLEILDKATVELVARSSKENFIKQVTKNTFVAESVVRAINPELKPPLLFV